MDARTLLDYSKFFTGMGLIVFAYLSQMNRYELIIAIGGLIILSSGVTMQFYKNKTDE